MRCPVPHGVGRKALCARFCSLSLISLKEGGLLRYCGTRWAHPPLSCWWLRLGFRRDRRARSSWQDGQNLDQYKNRSLVIVFKVDYIYRMYSISPVARMLFEPKAFDLRAPTRPHLLLFRLEVKNDAASVPSIEQRAL
jgi:hypothetical protein